MSNAQLASAGSVLAGILLLAWVATRPVTSPKKGGATVENAG
jgi:hypothetical protein